MSTSIEHVVAWLRTLLSGSSHVLRSVLDQARQVGHSESAVRAAAKLLPITVTRGKQGLVSWSLPPAVAPAPLPTPGHFELGAMGLTRADNVPRPAIPAPVREARVARADRPKLSVADRNKKAEERVAASLRMLKSRTPNLTRALIGLTEVALTDGPACPMCGRGQLRDEELRLRATIAALDRGGVSVAQKNSGDVGPSGPVLEFPPGTQLAIIASAPREDGEVGVSRAIDVTPHVTRADRVVPERLDPGRGVGQ